MKLKLTCSIFENSPGHIVQECWNSKRYDHYALNLSDAEDDFVQYEREMAGLETLTDSRWREMSHHKYAPKSMQQRLRDEWSEEE